MVHERTDHRYRLYDPDAPAELAHKYEVLNSAVSNVTGIMHALDRLA